MKLVPYKTLINACVFEVIFWTTFVTLQVQNVILGYGIFTLSAVVYGVVMLTYLYKIMRDQESLYVWATLTFVVALLIGWFTSLGMIAESNSQEVLYNFMVGVSLATLVLAPTIGFVSAIPIIFPMLRAYWDKSYVHIKPTHKASNCIVVNDRGEYMTVYHQMDESGVTSAVPVFYFTNESAALVYAYPLEAKNFLAKHNLYYLD